MEHKIYKLSDQGINMEPISCGELVCDAYVRPGRYPLKGVSDYEWANEVPDELIAVYLDNHKYDESAKYTEEEIEMLRKQFPKWFK